MFNMLIHCESLGITPTAFKKNIHNSYAVTPANEKKHHSGTPIVHIWDWTAECARRNGNIKNLLIACHGGYADKEKSQKQQGVLGIKLGSGLFTWNIASIGKLARRVSNIYLYVCGGAEDPLKPDILLEGATQSVHPDYATSNRTTCSLMAAHTEANVYASADLQSFDKSRFTGRFDFGKWEGKVEKFTPQGRIEDVTKRMNGFGYETGNE